MQSPAHTTLRDMSSRMTLSVTQVCVLVLTICAFLVASVASAPVDLDRRDVFVPHILYPDLGTVWKAGSRHNVTWRTFDAPVNITNSRGVVVFAQNDRMFTTEVGGLDNPLASGFDILLGRIEISVPKVAPGNDYQVVLFGDSGNFSPKFIISK